MRLPRTLVLLTASLSSTLHAQSASDWDIVRTSYGILTHVAGAALDRNLNSWQPAYEGGNAITAELSNPHMAQSDAVGDIYIADKESHSILKITLEGTIHTVAGTHVAGNGGDGPATQHQLSNPNGCFVLADGTLFILDLDNFKIRRVGTDGHMTTVIHDPDGLLFGRALWVSPDENLIYYPSRDPVGSPCLKRWTPTSTQVFSSGFTSIGNITVDHTGSPVVTEDSGNRVFRLDPNGNKTLIAGRADGTAFGGGDGFPATETGLDRVRGVACLPTGGFFLATQKGSHVWYVDTGGIIHMMVACDPTANPVLNAGNGQLYSTPGLKMNEPRAITIAPNGDLVITASDHGQIRVIKCIRPPLAPEQLIAEKTATLRLRWNGIPWQSYLIDHTPTMASPNWQPIGVRTSVPSAETLHTLPDQGGALQGFFRVRMPRW